MYKKLKEYLKKEYGIMEYYPTLNLSGSSLDFGLGRTKGRVEGMMSMIKEIDKKFNLGVFDDKD